MAHVVQHLAALTITKPNGVFSRCQGRVQTVRNFADRVAALAALLTSECGLQRGDRVALAAFNTDRSFEHILAVLAAGGLITLLNWRWSAQASMSRINVTQIMTCMRAHAHTAFVQFRFYLFSAGAQVLRRMQNKRSIRVHLLF